ncbi:hypothetical protein VMCG_08059 [Cytospora schulzeri]|uniref:Uncharacterized protein n=1 Tax=Cytospora schulzeri TaxID=448051 RepID=A0A423VR71_9PEZI|nr:hypothetical protein VMCG_08059 [Valsa malicola]
MDTFADAIDNSTMGANKMQPSPLLKLFGDDPDGKLQEVRDKIYSYVWSRDRRDEGKLDWVLSQNGINRNVPERLIEDTPYGSAAFKSIHELPCWLNLANKQISADFTRYIYSINDLEVDVDLKAIHTAENEAKLQRVTTLLQNPNFVCYTRVVRVRIHFPEKYSFQDLPAFNQRALEGIATILDGFEQIERLAVRVVSMQGPMDYELRLASFPFYPMSLTNWSIRMFNDATSKWDLISGEQLHQLNLAWDVYHATGCLTAQVNTRIDKEDIVPGGQAFDVEGIDCLPKKPVTVQHKNGSQKRKARKMRESAAATCTEVSTTPSAAAFSRPSSPVPTSLSADCPYLSRGTDLPESGLSLQSRSTNLEPSRDPSEARPTPELLVVSAISPSQPPSPPLSPIKVKVLKPDSTAELSASDTSGEVVVTPVDSSVTSPEKHDRTAITQPLTKMEERVDANEPTEAEEPQASRPPSPAPSSVTVCESLDEAENVYESVRAPDGVAPLYDELDSKPPLRKKRRVRRKPKRSKAADAQTIPGEGAEEQLVASGGQLNQDDNENAITQREADFKDDQTNLSSDLQMLQLGSGFTLWQFDTSLDVPMSEVTDVEPLTDSLCIATKTDGTKYVMRRTREVSWRLRKKERALARQLEKEAQKIKAKEKRQSKKVKEVLVRRRAPSHNLRRQIEDKNLQKVGKQPSSSKKNAQKLSDLEVDDREKEVVASGTRLGASIEMPVPDTGNDSTEGPGELVDDLEGYCLRSSQLAVSTQLPAHCTENYNGWATTGSTEDFEVRFEGQNTQTPTDQEMRTLHLDYANIEAPIESNRALANTSWQCAHELYDDIGPHHGSSTLFAGANSMNQAHYRDSHVEEHRIIEELDEENDAKTLSAPCEDDEGLVVRQDGEEICDEQDGCTVLADEMEPYDLLNRC